MRDLHNFGMPIPSCRAEEFSVSFNNILHLAHGAFVLSILALLVDWRAGKETEDSEVVDLAHGARVGGIIVWGRGGCCERFAQGAAVGAKPEDGALEAQGALVLSCAGSREDGATPVSDVTEME